MEKNINLFKNIKNRNKIKNFIIVFSIILFDQLTKFLFMNKNITIIPNVLKFTYIENTGAAFGIFERNVVLVTNIILVIGILIFLQNNSKNDLNNIPFILMISGSIGNLIDRILRGYVIDFINVTLFNIPIFNISDISIIIGFTLLIVLNFKNFFDIKKNIDKKNNDLI